MRASSALAALAMCLGASAAAPAANVGDYLKFTNRGQPMVREISSSETLLVWVETTEGVSNVHAAYSTTGYEPFQVTSFTEDGGAAIGLFGFYNDTLLHFDRRQTDGGNPSHRIAPPVGGLYAVPVAPAQTATLITSFPVEAVQGGRLYWSTTPLIDGGSAGNLAATPYRAAALVYLTLNPDGVTLAGGRTSAPVPLFETKHGSIVSFVISPSGRAVAFTNDRGDHGLLGVYIFGADSVTWVAPGYDSDTWPRWSADSSRLAWRRVIDTTDADGRDIRCKKHG